MFATKHQELINFLRGDLGLPHASLDIALKQWERDPGPLPIVLWQHGFVTLEQLEKIYDWLAESYV